MDIAAINRKAFSTLKELLPKEDPFLITAFDELETGFQSTVRLQFDVAAQVDAWKEKLQQETMTTFRRSRLRTGPRGQKEYLYCHHGYVRERKEPPKRKTKQTGCMARMDLTLNFKSESKRQRYRDFYMPEWPCVVSIKWIHNHAINSASALVYRDVGENVKERLMTLFHEGHSPATAHSVLKQEAADVCEGQLYQLSDRQKLPTYNDVWRYHLKYFQEKYGRFSGPLSVESVSDAIEALAETSASNIRSRKTEDGSMVSAIVTPLMTRVHEHHPQSGELVFVDSSGGMDKYNTRVFLLMTSSSLGGLPLGCFLTNSEKKATIEEALRLLMDMLPSYAFFGRGAKGPCLLMTDNSVPEKEALGAVFPESRQYLCTFHVLQVGTLSYISI